MCAVSTLIAVAEDVELAVGDGVILGRDAGDIRRIEEQGKQGLEPRVERVLRFLPRAPSWNCRCIPVFSLSLSQACSGKP